MKDKVIQIHSDTTDVNTTVEANFTEESGEEDYDSYEEFDEEEEQRQIISAVVKPSPYAELEKYFNQPRRY